MNQVTHYLTLDTHKSGIQKTLQGFYVGDNRVRKINISLVENDFTYELPDGTSAQMYVTKNGVTSINSCVVDGNQIVYEVQPNDTSNNITVLMQLKVFEPTINDNQQVLCSPRFNIEVMASSVAQPSSGSAEYTDLDAARNQAIAAYNKRITSISVDSDNVFKVVQADGTTLESDCLVETVEKCDEYATLAESYAHGNTGEREDEETDNAYFYSESARESSVSAQAAASSANSSATLATAKATMASEAATSASASEASASASAASANSSASSASASASSANSSALSALGSATSASESASSASNDALTASTSATNAAASETNADTYATSAYASSSSASASATSAQSWCKGGTGTRTGEDTNNAKYWCDKAERIAETQVSGVKGDKESTYRTGDVNITLANIGAMSDTNPVGTGSFSLNRKANTTVGDYSFAEGYDTIASGDYSHAEGEGTIASGEYSHAEGGETTASGYCSHAEGGDTTASEYYSHAEGAETTASGDCSHAEGDSTSAEASSAHAEGGFTVARSAFQHVQGKYNEVDGNGKYADIVGWGTNGSSRKNIETTDTNGVKWARSDVRCGGTSQDDTNAISLSQVNTDKMNKSNPVGTGSFSLNRDADSTVGDYSFAEGYDTIASGEYSHAENYSTTASGENSHAEGESTTASGRNSHAEGENTIASGSGSHAEGCLITTASGYYSHAEGRRTTASGDISHTEGNGTEASGDVSHAEGEGTIASSSHQHVQGKYNVGDSSSKYADIVGGGSNINNRANIETTDWNGVKWAKSDVRCGGTDQDDTNAISLTQLNSDLSDLTNEVSKRLPYDSISDLNVENAGFHSNTRGVYYYPSTASNKPTSSNDGLVVINYYSSQYIYEWAFVGNQNTEIYKRVKYASNNWTAWEKIPIVKTYTGTVTTDGWGFFSLVDALPAGSKILEVNLHDSSNTIPISFVRSEMTLYGYAIGHTLASSGSVTVATVRNKTLSVQVLYI